MPENFGAGKVLGTVPEKEIQPTNFFVPISKNTFWGLYVQILRKS